MSKFITGKELSDAVDKVIWNAKEELLIISPYIKLDEHFKELFDKQRHNHGVHILLMFGKNEGRVEKSFNRADLDYFKGFPNISIVYVPKLHAKYYANEKMGVITSINLYDYSFENNIEFGVLYESKGFSLFNKSSDAEVWNTCKDIASANPVIYIRRPIRAKSGYNSSKVLFDTTEELYNGKPLLKSRLKFDEFDDELDFEEVYSEMPTRQQVEQTEKAEKKAGFTYKTPKADAQKTTEPGYCIRTGEKIPFNPERPLSYQAFKCWSQFNNEEYPEKYCHFSGEPSNGETSVKRPILRKNWKKAQEQV